MGEVIGLVISHVFTDAGSVVGWVCEVTGLGCQSCLHRHRVGGGVVCGLTGWLSVMLPPTRGRWWDGGGGDRVWLSVMPPPTRGRWWGGLWFDRLVISHASTDTGAVVG